MYLDVGAVTVADLMDPTPPTVGRTSSLADVVVQFTKDRCHHVIVLAMGRQVAGIISRSHLLSMGIDPARGMPSDARLAALRAMPVVDHVTKVVETVHADHKAVTAASRMGLLNLSALPVTEGNKLVGLITAHDFVRWFGQQDLGRPSTPFSEDR